MINAPLLDVLIPTCNRPTALAITLAGVAAQTWLAQGGDSRGARGGQSLPVRSGSRHPSLRLVISDQSDGDGPLALPEVQAVLRLLQAKEIGVQVHRHLPRRGMAEQRAFLLEQVRAPHCLFLDDDVIIEADLIGRMLAAIRQQQCGFVGSALHGLSYVHEPRPDQQAIAFWDGKVEPESVVPFSPAWQRHHLHSAANLFHVQRQLGGTAQATRLYKVAWVGGCVLFDTAKLRAAGGFDFWPSLPPQHCGEDVLAQLRVMAQDGGCAIFPSGAYHMELPTTVRQRVVDAALLQELQGPDAVGDGAAAR